MAGFVVGPKEDIYYCSNSPVPVIVHEDGNPYDNLTFITAEPVTISLTSSCMNNTNNTSDYWLNVVDNNSNIGSTTINVDAPQSCVSEIQTGTSNTSNGRALIAFESASMLNHIYRVTGFNNNQITVASSLKIQLPQGAPVYTIRRYKYTVQNRQLRRLSWTNNCQTDPLVLDEPISGTGAGGIDAMQFRFLVYDPVTKSINTVETLSSDNISYLRGIEINLLVRSETPDREYTDNSAHTVGGIQVGAFNDNYRRVVVRKTVEVKNFGAQEYL